MVLHPCRCTDWGEIWHGGGTFGLLLHGKFNPNRCNASPLRGENPQNWPLRKLNTGRLRFAQCCRWKRRAKQLPRRATIWPQ